MEDRAQGRSNTKDGNRIKSDFREKRGRGEIGRRAGFRVLWVKPCGFKSRRPHQIRTQKRIQLFVPILRFLLLFRAIFAFLKHKIIVYDKKSRSLKVFASSVDMLFCNFVKFMGIR